MKHWVEYQRKAKALYHLTRALKYTREDVAEVRMTTEEEAQITYNNGYVKKVNVEGDSVLAVLRDVLKRV